MIILTLGFCYHVVHIYLHLFVHHVMKQRHHCSLIRCPDILQPKGYDLVAKGPPHSQERGLFHIFWHHSNLIIAREFVHEGNEECLAILSIKVSMCGRGKLSLRLALFKSR